MDYAKYSTDPMVSDLVKLSTANLKQLTVKVLKNGLRACGQSIAGKKSELAQRLADICQGIREYKAQAAEDAQFKATEVAAESVENSNDQDKNDELPADPMKNILNPDHPQQTASDPLGDVAPEAADTTEEAVPKLESVAASTTAEEEKKEPNNSADEKPKAPLAHAETEDSISQTEEPAATDTEIDSRDTEKDAHAAPASEPGKSTKEDNVDSSIQDVEHTTTQKEESPGAIDSKPAKDDLVHVGAAAKDVKSDAASRNNDKHSLKTSHKMVTPTTKSPKEAAGRTASANVVDDDHEDIVLDYGDEATTSETRSPEKSSTSTSARSKRSTEKRDAPASKRSRTDGSKTTKSSTKPDQDKPRRWLFVSNLRRPFTTRRLRTMLEEFGTIVDGDNGLMHDRFKTCCYVQYTSETDMRAAGKRLSGVVWPEETGQQLQTEIRSQNHLLVDDATTAAAPADGGARVRRGDVGSTDASNLARVQRNSINNDLSTAAVPPPPPRGRGGIFDRISAPTPSDTRDRDRSSGVRGRGSVHERLGMHADARSRRREESANDAPRNEERRRRSDRDVDNSRSRRDGTGKTAGEDESTTVTAVDALELLFKKTKAQPPLYWLPLTDEEIAAKKAEAAALEKARQERRREREKKQEEEKSERSRDDDRRDRTKDRRDPSRDRRDRSRDRRDRSQDRRDRSRDRRDRSRSGDRRRR